MNAPQVPAVIQALESRAPAFARALPSYMSVERFIADAKTTALANPDILRAQPRSVVMAVMAAALDGLRPDGREAAIVVRQGIATYQPMVRGLVTMLYRTGKVATVAVEVVREGDAFDFELGDSPFIKHKPTLRISGDMIAVYSVITMTDGAKSLCLMGREDVERIMQMSPSGWDKNTKRPKGIWAKHTSEMWKKTCLHRHIKVAPIEGMPPPPADDETAQIEDAAWLEPQDFDYQPPEPPEERPTETINGQVINPPKEEPKAPEQPQDQAEESPEAQETRYWKKELRQLRDDLSTTTTVGECEDEFNGWDAMHENMPADVAAMAASIVQTRVDQIKAMLAKAGDYQKAKDGV